MVDEVVVVVLVVEVVVVVVVVVVAVAIALLLLLAMLYRGTAPTHRDTAIDSTIREHTFPLRARDGVGCCRLMSRGKIRK